MTTLQSISESQVSKEVPINENFETLSAAGTFGKRHPVTSGLTWGYYGGRYNGNTIADGTVTLSNNTTNYVVAARSSGVVSTSTSTTNWTDTTNYAKLYQITTSGGVVTAVVDSRLDTGGLLLGSSSGGGGTELRGLTFTSDTDSTADSDPGNGLFKWNNATQGSATVLYFDNQTADAVSLTTFWASLGSAGFILLQQSDDSTKWQLWKWTATPTDGTGYRKFTVTLQANGGSIADAKTVYAAFSPERGSSLTFPYSADVSSDAEPQLEIYADGGSTQPGFAATTYSASNALNGGTFHCRAARGSLASPTALQSGDLIGGYGFRWCYTAGTFHTSSPTSIHCQVTENQTSGAWGSWLRFLTTPKGSTTRAERGGITDNGTMWIHGGGTYDATSSTQTLPVSDAKFVAAGQSGSDTGASFAAVGYGTDITPGFRGMAANGTPASPSAIPADRLMAFMGGHGYGSTGFSTGTKALLGFYSSQTWTDANQGTYIELGTTPNGSTTRASRVRIPEDGGIAIQDGITAPATLSGWAKIYVDSADGDLKVKFGDGTVKTIVVDT